jgi:dCMP deaminase
MRPTWEQYAMMLAEVASSRSEDPFLKVGCCLLREDKSVLGLGFNGLPSGFNMDLSDRDLRRPYMIHAELNALRYARPEEVYLLAVTHCPCPDCVRQIAAYRIKRVIFKTATDKLKESMDLAEDFSIHMRQV